MEVRLWQVCGGTESGGIAVREGADLASWQWPVRLATESLLWELSRRGNRLQYIRLDGTGPDTGWVSIECRGKALVAPVAWDTVASSLLVRVDVHVLRKVLQHERDEKVLAYLAKLVRCLEQGFTGAWEPSPQPGLAGPGDDWALLGSRLQAESGGGYDSAVMAKTFRRQSASSRAPVTGAGLERPYRVSVVAPTLGSRKDFHWFLWACFMGQTWKDKELIVVETYEKEPSSFFVEKARKYENIIYVGLPHELSIGLKRNIGLHLASGEVIANFDDDDLYAPNYIEAMLEHLEGQDAVAVTLSTWYDFDQKQNKCGFVDPIALGSDDPLGLSEGLLPSKQPCVAPEDRVAPPDARDTLFGYGFSYVHMRAPALSRPYPDTYLGEDVAFIAGLQESLGQQCVRLVRDEVGICLHRMHGGNTADSAVHRDATPDEVMGLAVWQFDFATPLREAWQASFSPSQVAGQFRHRDRSAAGALAGGTSDR